MLLMLVGVTVLGFGEMLGSERTSGVVTSYSTTTSYSTWTSTSFSVLYPTTVTRFSTASMTTDRLTQTSADGPYVMLSGTWGVFVEGIVEFDVNIESLIEFPIQSGVIQFDVAGLKVHRDDIELSFGAMPQGETITVKRTIGIPGINIGAKVTPLSVAINLSRKESIVSLIPLETSTRAQTLTETYRKTVVETHTVTNAYTVEEPFSIENTTIVAGLVLVVAAIAAAFVLMRMRKGPGREKGQEAEPLPQVRPPSRETIAQVPQPTVEAPTATPPQAKGVKYCLHCGAALPDTAMFCARCGGKQE